MNLPISEPTYEQIQQLTGAVMLEFGAAWCGYCMAAQGAIVQELTLQPQVQHIKIEDGKGRKLGRMFRVKRWPTLIMMKNRVELLRLERNFSAAEIKAALHLIAA